MNEIIKSFLEKNKIELSNQVIVVAVSTGIDSMALLNLLNNIKDNLNIRIVIAHVNHHKREQSEEEEKYIKEFAMKNSLECFVKEAYFDNASNFQMVARNLRYDFFFEVMKKVNSKYLFLAHHANDNMETILMRIIRGSNLKGYSGIEEISNYLNYTILRPFLSISKEEIKKYVNDNHIKFYEDSSNATLDYTRNRIRNEIVPLIEKEDEKVYQKFNDFSKLVLRANKSFENEVKLFIENNIEIGECLHFEKKCLPQEDKIFINEVLFALLKKYNLGKNNIEEIKKIIFSLKANLKIVYKNLFTIIKEYDNIYIYDTIYSDFECEFMVDHLDSYRVNDKISICVSEKTDNSLTNLNVLWYNTNMFPLTIRTRRPGDKIWIGNGFRKVKDVLIDEKIGIRRRDEVIVAVDCYGEILIIFGIKKSTKLKEIKNCNIFIEYKEN